MTTKYQYGSEVLPNDFFAEVVAGDVAITRRQDDSELCEARDLAATNPGKWVRVGVERWLKKSPSGWCSEVKYDKKKALTGYPGKFHACYYEVTEPSEPAPDSDERKWGKCLMYIPEETA